MAIRAKSTYKSVGWNIYFLKLWKCSKINFFWNKSHKKLKSSKKIFTLSVYFSSLDFVRILSGILFDSLLQVKKLFRVLLSD